MIQRQDRKLERLVNDMLEVTRLETQPQRYPKEELDLTELVESLCYDMALIQEKGIRLSCEAEPEIKYCGNYELLTRMLSNLISNAYRYGKENGHIYVRLSGKEAAEACEAITLSVEDDGIGIAKEEQEQIFHRFYQADTARTGEGSGLGLAMVREIVQFHGGRIEVTSSPGEGSVFTVII